MAPSAFKGRPLESPAMEASWQADVPRPRELPSDKAARIVDAMRASVSARGISGSTFDHVAREAGVSRGLLHYYFGTKERLLVEVVRRETDVRKGRMEAAIEDADTADGVLDALVGSFQDFLGAGPTTAVMVYELLTVAQRNAEIAAELAELGRSTRAHLADILRFKAGERGARTARRPGDGGAVPVRAGGWDHRAFAQRAGPRRGPGHGARGGCGSRAARLKGRDSLKRLAVIATAAVVLIVLIVAQLVLPGIATNRLRDRLSESGTVLSVKISAFPAIELLWHQADRVVVRMGQYHPASSGDVGTALAQTADVGSLDASASEFQSGLLTLRDATLTKRGTELTGTALVTEADLRASVPFLQNVVPVASGGGQLTLRGTATLFGLTATVQAIVAAVNGQLVVQPDVPFGGLATVTVFANPHLYVEGVGAHAAQGGFSVLARGQLH